MHSRLPRKQDSRCPEGLLQTPGQIRGATITSWERLPVPGANGSAGLPTGHSLLVTVGKGNSRKKGANTEGCRQAGALPAARRKTQQLDKPTTWGAHSGGQTRWGQARANAPSRGEPGRAGALRLAADEGRWFCSWPWLWAELRTNPRTPMMRVKPF